jgi:hypothetical protein
LRDTLDESVLLAKVEVDPIGWTGIGLT